MPGIVGIVKRGSHEEARKDLDLMIEAMRHENYYAGNQFVNKDLGLYLGWLSHPRSLGDYMPLTSCDGRFVLVMIGENFPDAGVYGSLKGQDALRADAQNLLTMYEQSEDKLLESLNGWFSGVAVDLALRKITLFNDRYAMSRIYFHEGEDEFAFAAEAKSLLKVRPSLRAIDPEAFAQSLRYNCVMGNKTLFKGVSLLPAASVWTFTGSAVPRKRRYFDYSDWEQQPTLNANEFYEKFDNTVAEIFPRYMEGPSQVGLSLTSGLDTRVILAAAGSEKRILPCYTFGGLWGETFDVRAARKLATMSGLPHEYIRITEPFLNQFAAYAEKSVYISDGTHDAFGAHDVYFNEVAHKIAPIRLTGKFGSEVVRERRLIPKGDFPRHLLQPWLGPYLDNAPFLDKVAHSKNPLTRVVSEDIPWYEYGRVSVEQSKVTMRTPYLDNSLVKLMYQAPLGVRSSRDLQVRYIQSVSRALADVPTNMGRMANDSQPMGRVIYTLYWALFKAEYFYLYATPHWITRIDRKLGALNLERIITGRQKFEAYRIWIKTHLAESIREILLNPNARCTEFFDKSSVERAVKGHTAGTHNYFYEINKMLTLELICSSLLHQ